MFIFFIFFIQTALSIWDYLRLLVPASAYFLIRLCLIFIFKVIVVNLI